LSRVQLKGVQQVFVHKRRPHAERPVAGGQIDLAGGVRADVGKRLIDRAEPTARGAAGRRRSD
jgi:hypothetical protein